LRDNIIFFLLTKKHRYVYYHIFEWTYQGVTSINNIIYKYVAFIRKEKKLPTIYIYIFVKFIVRQKLIAREKKYRKSIHKWSYPEKINISAIPYGGSTVEIPNQLRTKYQRQSRQELNMK